MKQLEATLDETRRRLTEERRMKENYEDLLTALRAEIEEYRNERDNLRDEIVPRLRARVEGLESESAQFQRLTYEHSRTQQELQYLKVEYQQAHGRRRSSSTGCLLQAPPTGSTPSVVFNPIAGKDPSHHQPHHLRLAPSSSSSQSRQRPSPTSSSSSSSSPVPGGESRESLSDRVKDVEAQRDALHRALRSLLDRHEHQNREHAKRVKALQTERDRAIFISSSTSSTSQRSLLGGVMKNGAAGPGGVEGHHHHHHHHHHQREISNLRDEVHHLRRRADQALEQKWRGEKILSQLKVDLDHSRHENESLRTLLEGHGIFVSLDLNSGGCIRGGGGGGQQQ